MLKDRSWVAWKIGSGMKSYSEVDIEQGEQILRRGRTGDETFEHVVIHRFSWANYGWPLCRIASVVKCLSITQSRVPKPTIVRPDIDQLCLLHRPQRRLITLEREVHQHIMVRDLLRHNE